MRPAAIALFFWHLANAQRGGLALADALAILARDPDLGRAESALIAHLGAQVSGGSAFSSALESQRATFAPETVELVRAAESENALPEALELLAADYEQRALQRLAVRGALAWPAAIAAFLLVLVPAILGFVVPAYKEVFSSFGADLPGPTLLLIAVADYIVGYWYVWLALIVIAVVFAWRGGRLPGRAWVDRALLRLPFVRPYLVKAFVSRVSRALAVAAEGRLPLPPTLAYLRATAGNRRLAESAATLESGMRAGKSLSAAVRESAHLPGQLAVALEIGERSNNLAPALRQLVALSEGDAARSLVRLQQAALIALYVCLALVVGFVVIALYLPIFGLGAAV